MKKAYLRLFFVCILLTAITGNIFSQAQTDSSKEDLEKVFTAEEIKPSFKHGSPALNTYLTQQVNTSTAVNNEEGVVMFIVSSKGNIREVKRVAGNLSFEDAVESALLRSSGKWHSAMQNNHHVAAYCKLRVIYHTNKIKAIIE